MESFRAFVADLLPEEQRTRGFAMQSLFIGLGAVVASALPWMMTNFFHVQNALATGHAIPLTVRFSFYVGAVAFLSAVIWTIVSTKEYPPDDLEAFAKMKRQKSGVLDNAREISRSIGNMPPTMKQLAWVQLFTWLGLFCMWLYFPVAVAHNVFGAADQASPVYARGVEWAGICFGLHSAVCFVFSFVLPALAGALDRSIDRKVKIILTMRKEHAQLLKQAANPPGESAAAEDGGETSKSPEQSENVYENKEPAAEGVRR
jgi:maltose/moltooligosaccharide transporter